MGDSSNFFVSLFKIVVVAFLVWRLYYASKYKENSKYENKQNIDNRREIFEELHALESPLSIHLLLLTISLPISFYKDDRIYRQNRYLKLSKEVGSVVIFIAGIVLLVSVINGEDRFGYALFKLLLVFIVTKVITMFLFYLFTVGKITYQWFKYKDFKYLLRGNYYSKKGEHQTAVEQYQKAIEIFPSEYAYLQWFCIEDDLCMENKERGIDNDYSKVRMLSNKLAALNSSHSHLPKRFYQSEDPYSWLD